MVCRIVPPLIRAFNTLPPTFPSPLAPPLTHIIHSLITTPITPSLRSLWFPPDLPATPPSSTPGTNTGNGRKSTSNPTSTSQSPTITSDSLPSTSSSGTATTTTAGATNTTTSPKPDHAKPGAFDRAMNMLGNAGRRMSSRPTSPMPGYVNNGPNGSSNGNGSGSGSGVGNSVASNMPHFDTLQRAYDLFELSMAYYLPGTSDPDSSSFSSPSSPPNPSSSQPPQPHPRLPRRRPNPPNHAPRQMRPRLHVRAAKTSEMATPKKRGREERRRRIGGKGGYVGAVFEGDGVCEVGEDEGCGGGDVVCLL